MPAVRAAVVPARPLSSSIWAVRPVSLDRAATLGPSSGQRLPTGWVSGTPAWVAASTVVAAAVLEAIERHDRNLQQP